MHPSDVSDSTDWLATRLPCLAAVEGALRCQVCKDFFKTPVITSCSHTFCSICIRRALSNDGKCPLCRALEQEVRLRSNWSMEEAVDAFSNARPTTLALAQAPTGHPGPSKRHHEMTETDEMSSSPEAKRLRTSARLSNQHEKGRNRDSHESGGAIIVAASEGVDKSEDEADPASGSVMGKSGSAQIVLEESDPSLMPADGLVPCPSCLKRMKEWQVFQHLEACPGPSSPNIAALPSFLNNQRAQGQELRQRTKIERLPAMNYSILKEQALRRKLAEIGISSTGSRTLLEKRHREWLNIWNANCDAAQPRNRAQLLQDLDMWEKSQGQRPGRGGTSNAIVITDKNFDAGAWAAKHDSSFKDLIRNARSKATVPSVIDQGLGPGSEQSAPDPLPGGALISDLGTDHPDQKTPADGESPGAPTIEST